MEGQILVTTTVTKGYGMQYASASDFTQEPWEGTSGLEWISAGGQSTKCKGQNLSLAFVRFDVTDSKSNKARNLPKIAFKVNGIRVRNNSGTYVHTSNPAWVLRDYLTNSIYGCGIADADIDFDTFISLNDDHLREMKLTLGNRIKILKEIDHLSTGKYLGVR